MNITNTAWGIIGSRILGRPFYGRVHVTYRCNYRCGMCGVSRNRGQFDELPASRLALVSHRLWALGARHLVLTGGEPFLRRDLAEVVRVFARRGFSIRIQTNGGPQVTRERLREVVEAGVCDLSVSVDTLDPRLQDRICGASGVLENALRTLELSQELLPRGMSLANIVGSPMNFLELPALVRYFGRRGIYSYITPVVVCQPGGVSGGEYLFRSDDSRFDFGGLAPAERDRVIDELVALRRGGAGLTNSTRFLEDFRRFLETGRNDWTCSAGKMALDVRPDGSVSACKEKPPLGNILDESFASYYRSPGFARSARAQADSCSGCFYAEYREPDYAVRDITVLREWTVDWLRTFRKGMDWRGGRAPGPVE
ncbi:MAG: radical SAM protein [Vicinamibacterales bacterium]